jgi:O-antigen ligase
MAAPGYLKTSLSGKSVTPALLAGAAALLCSVGLTALLYRYPPPSVPIVVLAGAGSVGVLLLALTRYEMAAALGIALMGVVRVEPAPPDFVLTTVVIVALITGRFDLSRVPLIASGTVAAFLALNVLSMVEIVDPARASFFVSITLYLAVFGLWLTTFVDSERRARLVLTAYLFAAVSAAVVGTAAVTVPGLPDAGFFTYGPTGQRAMALFKDPNVFGPFMVPAFLILLEETIHPRLLRASRSIKLALLLVLLLGVLFSFSRAAWLNLAVGFVAMLGVMALRRGGGRRAGAILAIALVTAVVTASVLAVTGSVGFLEDRASVQAYDSQRFGAQKLGLEIALTHPFGIGPGQFEIVSPTATHSIYVRVLTEEGWLGFVCILVLLFGTLTAAGRNVIAGRSTYGIGSAALFGAWFGILANSFFVDTLHWRHLWLVAALVWAGLARARLGDETL